METLFVFSRVVSVVEKTRSAKTSKKVVDRWVLEYRSRGSVITTGIETRRGVEPKFPQSATLEDLKRLRYQW